MTDDRVQGQRKVSVVLKMDESLIERLRNAVWHVGRGLTMAGVMRSATLKALEELENDYSQDEPFPPRQGKLSVGKVRRRGEAIKVQAKMRLAPEDLERLRNAVAFFLARGEPGWSVSAVIEGATHGGVEELERAPNEAKPFPPREGD